MSQIAFRQTVRLWLPVFLLCSAGPLPTAAEEWNFLGARYQAMGGAGVAVANDGFSAYWNPGALAFTDSYDVSATVGASASAEGGILEDVDRLAQRVQQSQLDSILAKVQTGAPLTDVELREALGLTIDALALLDTEGQGFLGSAEAGLGIRVNQLALTGLGLGHWAVNPIFDTQQLAFSSDLNAAAQIANIVGVGSDRSAQLSPDGLSLAGSVQGIFEQFTNTGNEAFQAQELVFQAELAGLDTSNARIRSLTESIARATSQVGGGDLATNNSGALVQGLVTAEVGLSYGFPLLDVIGIGGNIRYIHGTTFFDAVRYSDGVDSGSLIDNLTDSSRRRESDAWGVDVGILLKPFDWVRVGVVGRNLNSPSFKVDVPTQLLSDPNSSGLRFTLDPQVRAGVALDLLPNWTLAADLDLTKNRSETLEGYRSRLASLGTELRVPVGPIALALRAGGYLNTAPDQDNHPVLTAGLGLEVWHLELDVAGGISLDRQRIETSGSNEKFPSRANLSAGLSWNQRF